MAYIISLLIILFLILFYKKEIKKYPLVFYFLILIIDCFAVIKQNNIISTHINLGYPSLALLVIVMFIGAFSKKNKTVIKLIAIRGILSIGAVLLLIPHGIIQFVKYSNQLADWGILIGILALLIMIPLFITSFMFVRKKMKANQWKSLHKWSYVVYFLTYLHLYFLSTPTNQLLYTITFVCYTLLRLHKGFMKKNVYTKYALYLIVLASAFFLSYHSPNSVNIDLNNGTYQNGTYTGQGTGYRNLPVSVQLTIANNKITNINVTNCGCTGYQYSQIVTYYANEIVNTQSTNIDAYSGATHSTNGLLEAIGNALNKAKK